MRYGEQLGWLDLDHLALVLIRLAVPFALVNDRTAFLPIGARFDAEEPLLDQLGPGEGVADLAGRRGDFRGYGILNRANVAHRVLRLARRQRGSGLRDP